MIMKKHTTTHTLGPAADKPATEALNIGFAPLVAGFYDARRSRPPNETKHRANRCASGPDTVHLINKRG